MSERDYQIKALDATNETYDAGVRKMLHVMATGTGKTRVFGTLFESFSSRLPGKQLVLAHTDELVKQNATKMQEVNPANKVGIEMAGCYADEDCDIVSASVQTLGRKGSDRVQRFTEAQGFDKFVIDEAHHSTSESYQRVLNAVGVLAPSSKSLLLGVTATSQRSDGIALSDVYDKVAFTYDIRQAIKEGWLVNLRGYRVKTGTNLSGVSTVAGDFVKSELSLAVNTPDRNKRVVEAWQQYGENRKSVVYCVDIQHAKDMAWAFMEAGVDALAVWGDDPCRTEKLAHHRDGRTKVLCNCSLLIEGYDDPEIACIVDAAPGLSPVRYTQKIGRSTRLEDGVNLFVSTAAKRDSIVIDVADNCTRHSVVSLPSLMGISANLDLEGRSVLECVEEMEAAQEKFPSIDLTKLDKIGDLKTVVSKIDLLEIRFPAEVEANSELTWFRAIDGGYKMLVPKEYYKQGQVRIFENALGQWELWGSINAEEFHGIRTTYVEAFKVADEQIRKRVSKQTLSCIKREGTWQNKPVTKSQIGMLKRLFKNKPFPFEHMTSGQASKIISERLGRFQ